MSGEEQKRHIAQLLCYDCEIAAKSMHCVCVFFDKPCEIVKRRAETIYQAGYRYNEIKKVSDRYSDDQEEEIRQIANSISASKYGRWINNIELLASDLWLFGYVDRHDLAEEIFKELLERTERVDVESTGVEEVVFLKDIKELFAEKYKVENVK